MISVHTQAHPLTRETKVSEGFEGQTIAQIVAAQDLKALPKVSLVRTAANGGVHAAEIPLDMWDKVRPKAGTRVYMHVPVRGAVAGLAASVLVSAAAPSVAGWLGFTAGTFAYAATVAAVSLVGALAINQLISPAPAASVGSGKSIGTSYTITGASNQLGTGAGYPKVLGRHRIYPPMSATGYTEVVDGEVYYRGRYAIGWGPVCLEEILLGTTPITEYEDIEVEFLNVEQAETEANISGLSAITRAWRTGTEELELYADDITQDGYNVRIEYDADPVVRNTRPNTVSAVVVVGLPSGLYRPKTGSAGLKDGGTGWKIAYREVGSAAEPVEAHDVYIAAILDAGHQEAREIVFPHKGEWEIILTKTIVDYTSSQGASDTYLAAIQSNSSRSLPSHAGIAEIAIRAKATDQLNGQIDNLSVIAQQMAPVYDGTAWSAPQPVRHPAWVYADMLTGQHLGADAIALSRLDADAFLAWYEDEAHWKCDHVIDGDTSVMDALDTIAATGRAKRGLRDLRWSIIREDAAAPVRQVFTPENYFDFSAQIVIPREVHALTLNVISEGEDWGADQFYVYADGYDETTATEFEEMDLPGIVVGAGEDQGNAWRLGRYFLAVADHRRETFSFGAEVDHLSVTTGDKIALTAPVMRIHHNGARVRDVELTEGGLVSVVELDEQAPALASEYRLVHRSAKGIITPLDVTSDAADPYVYALDTAADIVMQVGDLVSLEQRSVETFEAVVTKVEPDTNETARITCVSAAPDVLQADSGTIPAYVPLITDVASDERGPRKPSVSSLQSDLLTARRGRSGVLFPRAAVAYSVSNWAQRQYVRLRWRVGGQGRWTVGERAEAASILHTGDLSSGSEYQVQIATEDQRGNTRGWVNAGTVTASVRTDVLAAPSGWAGYAGIANVTLRGDAADADDFREFRIYGATAEDTALVLAGRTPAPEFNYAGPFTQFRVCMVDHDLVEGDLTDWIHVEPRGLTSDDFRDQVVEWESIADSVSSVIAAAQSDATTALADAGAAQSAADAARDVADTLRTEYDLEAATNALRDAALDQVDEHLLDLVLSYSEVKETIADAGIVVDPATGSVTIAGLANVEGRVQQVETGLDAVNAEVSLKASVAQMNSAIAAAQLPEASVAALEDTIARVDTVELDLNALTGAITLDASSTLWDINDAEVGILALKGAIEVAQGAIDLKASQSDLDVLSSELTNAQIELSALDGASIRQTAQDTREMFDGLEDQAALTLGQVLDEYEGRNSVRQDIAFVRDDMTARLNDTDEAVARVVQQITSEVAGNRADIVSESKTRASETEAIALNVEALTARVGTSEGDITELNRVAADSDSVLARSVFSVTGRMDTAEGAINALNTVSVTSDSVLARTVATVTGAVEDAEAAISEINRVAVDSDSAIARSVHGLSGRVGTAEGAINQLNTVDATSTSALVQAFRGVEGRVAGTEGEINDLYNVNIALKNALVQKILEIESTVGGKTVSITSLMESVDGIEGQWGVEIDNNGRVTGVSLVSDPSQRSNFIVLADAFKIVGPNMNVSPFVVRTTAETVNGVTYPAGVYISNAYMDAAQIVGTLKSTNFSTANKTGWRIQPDGTAHLYGAVISRPMVVAEGVHALPSPLVINSPTWSTVYESGLLDTGYEIDVANVWMPADAVYRIEAAFYGSVTGVNIGDGTQEYWEAKAELVKAARWSGPQQFRMRLKVEGKCRTGASLTLHNRGGSASSPGEIHWTIYKVT